MRQVGLESWGCYELASCLCVATSGTVSFCFSNLSPQPHVATGVSGNHNKNHWFLFFFDKKQKFNLENGGIERIGSGDGSSSGACTCTLKAYIVPLEGKYRERVIE